MPENTDSDQGKLEKDLHYAVSYLDYKKFKSLVKQGANPFSSLEKDGKDIPTRLDALTSSELKNNREFGVRASKFLLRHELRKDRPHTEQDRSLPNLPKGNYELEVKMGTPLYLRNNPDFDKTSDSDVSKFSYSSGDSDNESQRKPPATSASNEQLDMDYSSSDSESVAPSNSMQRNDSSESIDFTYSSDSESEELPSVFEKLGISKSPSSYAKIEEEKENKKNDQGLPPMPPR